MAQFKFDQRANSQPWGTLTLPGSTTPSLKNVNRIQIKNVKNDTLYIYTAELELWVKKNNKWEKKSAFGTPFVWLPGQSMAAGALKTILVTPPTGDEEDTCLVLKIKRTWILWPIADPDPKGPWTIYNHP